MNRTICISAATLLMTIAMLITTGCLTPQSYTPLAQYTIEPDLNDLPNATLSDYTLGIRRFGAAQTLKRDIFYRDPDLRVGNLLDAQWAEFPADMMTRYIFDAAATSGRFRDVGLATDLSRPTFLLTGDLRKFDLDRSQDPWHAVCQIHFELRTVSNSQAAWSRTLTASVPLTENTIPALPKAMSEATTAVIHQAMTAIAQANPER
jgi:ABC-type uncharacterized transport system auxiliary subunit